MQSTLKALWLVLPLAVGSVATAADPLIDTSVLNTAAERTVFPADRQEIEDLISSYSRSFDSHEIDDFLALFTSDATLEFYAAGASAPLVSAAGTDALRALVAKRFGLLEARAVRSRHFQTNTLLALHADGVVNGTTLLNLVWQIGEDRPTTVMTGVYVDVFTRVDGHWKIARRTLLMDQRELPK
jgi:hypothetical protein